MKPGRRPQLPSEKKAKGTFQPCRDGHLVEIVEPMAMPNRPDWLTPHGEEVWIDDIGRVSAHRFVSERDTTIFGNYCNLQGAIIQTWRAGEVPPAAHLMEVRKLAELFGICGAKSRLKVAAADEAMNANPFAKYARRTG